MSKRILFISNGHGEDDHSSNLIRTLRDIDPTLDFAALPIVGEGAAYRRIGARIIAPTLVLPSGGFTYMDRRLLIDDIRAGLLRSTVRQWRAMRREARGFDLVFATGDSVGQSFAFGSGLPFVSFISPLSALYTGQLRIDMLLQVYFRSPRCLRIVTRDPYTAENLRSRGFAQASFGGIPGLDFLRASGRDLKRAPGAKVIGFLPGSRVPEARRSMRLLMRLAEIAAGMARANASLPRLQFRAATVPGVLAGLADLAAAEGWTWTAPDRLHRRADDGVETEILCYSDAFADIVDAATLMVSMSGLAVDEAIALGKPALLIPTEGPQHTYRFAEAAHRMHGLSSEVIGTGPADDAALEEAARRMFAIVANRDYLESARANGPARLGGPGGSRRIADMILGHLRDLDREERKAA